MLIVDISCNNRRYCIERADFHFKLALFLNVFWRVICNQQNSVAIRVLSTGVFIEDKIKDHFYIVTLFNVWSLLFVQSHQFIKDDYSDTQFIECDYKIIIMSE